MGNGNGSAREPLVESQFDPDDPSTDVELDIDDEQNRDSKERGLRIGLWVVAAIDAISMIIIIIAILVQQNNRDNYIFLLNIQHVLWWFVTALITNVAANKVWWSVYIGFSALWLVMDVGSLLWRAILLHNCYDSSSGDSCRDFLIQSWFIIICNGVFIITDIVFITLGVLLRRKVMFDRLRCKKREEERERLRRGQHMQPQPALRPPLGRTGQVGPQFAQQQTLLVQQPQQAPSGFFATSTPVFQNPQQTQMTSSSTMRGEEVIW